MEITIEDHSEEVIAAKNNAIERALEAIGLQAEGYVKLELRTPRPHSKPRVKGGSSTYPIWDTGRLGNSMTHVVKADEETVYIGTNVEYAPYVELGTMHSRAYPYLKPAIEKNAAEYENIAKSFLKGE